MLRTQTKTRWDHYPRVRVSTLVSGSTDLEVRQLALKCLESQAFDDARSVLGSLRQQEKPRRVADSVEGLRHRDMADRRGIAIGERQQQPLGREPGFADAI